MIGQRTLNATLAMSVSAFALTNIAFAQETDRRQLDQIVVTAQKKAENLQDVPASISAFNEEALVAKRIAGLEDIAQFTPGLYTYPSAADSNGLRIALRGVGTFDPQIGVDSRVAIYVDGLYLGKTQGLAFDSPDLARVEVLKGPQGTLYGRNSVAGAINLISVRPSDDGLSGRASVGYGNFGTVEAKAGANIPLADGLGLRVSGLYNNREGWVENNGLGEDFNGYKRWGGRAALGYEATDNLYLEIASDYVRSDNQVFFYQALTNPANDGQIFSPAVNTFDGRQEEVSTEFTNGVGSAESWGVVGTAEFDWRENHNIKVVTGYRRAESDRFVTLLPDASGEGLTNILTDAQLNIGLLSLPTILGLEGITVRPDYFDEIPRDSVDSIFASVPEGQPALDGHEQFSVDFTATGSVWDDKIDYVFGAFYFDEDTSNRRDLPVTNTRDAQDYLLVLAALGPLAVLRDPTATPDDITNAINAAGDLTGSARNSASGLLAIETQAWAVYTQLTWHVTDRLRLTGGIRYSDETRDGFGQINSPFFADTTTLLGDPILPNIASLDGDSIDPAVIVEYDLTDEILVYASRKESFRAGGFNAVAVSTERTNFTSDCTTPNGSFGEDFVFCPEEITAYEAGFKADLLDNRLRLNAAGYFYNFTNEQATVQTNPLLSTDRAVVNTDTEVWGAEVDAILLLGDGLTFTGNYSYTDGDPGDRVNPVTDEVVMRDRLQGAPRNSYTVALDYESRLTNNLDFFSGVSFNHKDSASASPGVTLTNQNLLAARVGVNHELANGQTLTLTFWGENLTDDVYTIDEIDFSGFAYSVAVFGTPRTYGATVSLNF